MDYICYISRAKVDQLHEQLNPQIVLEQTERVTRERKRSSSVDAGLNVAGIVNLFKGGITYGRSEVLQQDQKIKLAYTEKLRDVLLAIAADHGEIPDVEEAFAVSQIDKLYYYYSGSFHVDPLRNAPQIEDVLTISSRIGAHQLELDCSIRYFSESDKDGSRFLIHSGNQAFFSGRVRLNFSTVFILLGVNGYRVVGTPLYLQLAIASFSHHSL